MKDRCTYHLKLHGQVSADEIYACSPIQLTVEQVDADGTWLAICTDQSGLVGLMSYLSGLGLIFLAMTRVDLAGGED